MDQIAEDNLSVHEPLKDNELGVLLLYFFCETSLMRLL